MLIFPPVRQDCELSREIWSFSSIFMMSISENPSIECTATLRKITIK